MGQLTFEMSASASLSCGLHRQNPRLGFGERMQALPGPVLSNRGPGIDAIYIRIVIKDEI
jgi:hypothetical protein